MSLFARIFITRNFKKIRDQIKHIALLANLPYISRNALTPKKTQLHACWCFSRSDLSVIGICSHAEPSSVWTHLWFSWVFCYISLYFSHTYLNSHLFELSTVWTDILFSWAEFLQLRELNKKFDIFLKLKLNKNSRLYLFHLNR